MPRTLRLLFTPYSLYWAWMVPYAAGRRSTCKKFRRTSGHASSMYEYHSTIRPILLQTMGRPCEADNRGFPGSRNHTLDDVLELPSVRYNQFQHAEVRPMWLCEWRMGDRKFRGVRFPSLADMLFMFKEAWPCLTARCTLVTFIRCLYCKLVLCEHGFYVN